MARNETRATTIVAALAESQPVSLSSLPLAAYTAEIRRDWRDSGKDTDPAELTDDLAVIFDRLGTAVRTALERGDWDWGDHPPSSFALWLERKLGDLQTTGLGFWPLVPMGDTGAEPEESFGWARRPVPRARRRVGARSGIRNR